MAKENFSFSNSALGMVIRVIVSPLLLVGGLCIIVYTMLWDFVREKLLGKKPIKQDCPKVVENKCYQEDNQEINTTTLFKANEPS